MRKNELQWAIISQNDPQRGRMSHIDSTMAQNDPKLAPPSHNEPLLSTMSQNKYKRVTVSYHELELVTMSSNELQWAVTV